VRAGRGAEPAELLDAVGDERSSRPVEPVRPRETLDELPHVALVLLPSRQRTYELSDMLVEVAGDVQ
jgi:hypothetical protein